MKRWLPLLVLLAAGTARAALVEVSSSALGTNGIEAMALNAATPELFINTQISTGVVAGTGTETTSVEDYMVNASSLTFQHQLVYSSTYTEIADLKAGAVVLEDPTQNIVYYAFGQSSPTVVAVNESSFVQIASATIPDAFGFGHVGAGVIDTANHILYLGSTSNPAQVIKMDGATLNIISSVTLTASDLRSAAIDTVNHFAYFGSSAAVANGNGAVSKINLQTFKLANTLTFSGAGGAASMFVDPSVGYLWVGTNDIPGSLVRIRLSDFAFFDRLAMHAKEDRLATAIYDSTTRLAYFGTNSSSAVIVAVDPVRMKWKSELVLDQPKVFVIASALDAANQYGYFATHNQPGYVLKIDLIGGPPEITGSPSDQEVLVGSPASFFVTASGRGMSYQWKRDGAAIAGATSTSYQIPAVTLDDDSAHFYCTVSNDKGSADSAAATLTVQPDVHVYPNPWRSNRHAGVPLSFSGLPTGAVVKIFTLAAQHVRTVSESGGHLATWDLKTDGGQNAASGYYFYFIKTANERQESRGKFALIR